MRIGVSARPDKLRLVGLIGFSLKDLLWLEKKLRVGSAESRTWGSSFFYYRLCHRNNGSDRDNNILCEKKFTRVQEQKVSIAFHYLLIFIFGSDLNGIGSLCLKIWCNKFHLLIFFNGLKYFFRWINWLKFKYARQHGNKFYQMFHKITNLIEFIKNYIMRCLCRYWII